MSFSPAWKKLEEMSTGLVVFLPQLAIALVVFAVFWLTARSIRVWVRRLVNRTVPDGALGGVLGQIAYGGVIVLGALIATALMGVGIGSLLAGLGVSGFVIGFALKDILENYIAGILLMLSRPFELGDEIKSGAFSGRVLRVETRSTTIETHEGQVVIIPNAQIFTNPLVNETRHPRRQTKLSVKLTAATGLEEQLSRLRQRVAAVPGVLADPPTEALLEAPSADGVDVTLRFWTAPQHQAQRETANRVALALQESLFASAGRGESAPDQG